MLDRAPLELPARYVVNPFSVTSLRCPWCARDAVVEEVTAVGRGARATARCAPCGLRLLQETRPIPGRRVA